MRATWRPLAQWPYPPRPSQVDRFQSTWGATLQKLEAEISAIDGREIIIGFVGDDSMVRIDGQMRADARPRHPGAEVSFEVPSKDGWRRLIFHTDAFANLGSNLRGIALGLEALRAVDRYGVTSGTEQYAGFAQLAPGGPSADRGKTLVEQAGSIKDALRKHHPDHGGQERDFVDVQAYRKAVGL